VLAVALLLPVAYLLGTFPSASLVARSQGVDIATIGSGNPGASNVGRVLGARWGVLVFTLDGLKGAIPAAVGLLLGQRAGAYLLVAAAVLGHMFPITRRGRGGKGVATMAGAMIVLQPVASAVVAVVWLAVRRVGGSTASVGSLAMAVALPVVVAVLGAPAWEVAAIIALCALVALRHTDNIRRLRAGTEL
jgi:acyl phosphate:glycerol-3-phosphate acyltransferase